MRPFYLAFILLLALAAAPARAQDDDDKGDGDRGGDRHTLSVKTSLGPIEDDGRRELRARGQAPKGSKITVRFYRGKKKIATRRMPARKQRYKAAKPIDRTGSYKVVVVARTRAGGTIRVSARLKYGPKAEAPSAPEDEGGE